MQRDQSLLALVRRADIRFELLVERLMTPGYITDLDNEPGLSLGRVRMESASQDDFDALFRVLMPDQRNTVKLRSHATDKGARPGLFTYALYNEAVISDADMQALLLDINRQELL